MFTWEPLLTPPETLQEMLWRLEMTQDEYLEHLDEIEKQTIDAYMHL